MCLQSSNCCKPGESLLLLPLLDSRGGPTQPSPSPPRYRFRYARFRSCQAAALGRPLRACADSAFAADVCRDCDQEPPYGVHGNGRAQQSDASIGTTSAVFYGLQIYLAQFESLYLFAGRGANGSGCSRAHQAYTSEWPS